MKIPTRYPMRAILIPLAWLICFGSHSQGLILAIQPGTFKADQSQILGHYIILPYSTELVEKSLLKYLRDFGRTEKIGGFLLTTDLDDVSSVDYDVLFFSKVETAELGSRVWMGIDSVGIGGQNLMDFSVQIEKLLLNFGREVHVGSLQDKIVRAELDAVNQSRDFQKLVNQQATLERKSSFNEAERIRLEEALARNAAEKTDLLERTELNLSLQKRATEDLQQKTKKLEQLRMELSDFQETF